MLAFTHVGTATALLEVEGVRLLTDPAFDPPERRYSFGWGTGSTKLRAPRSSPSRWERSTPSS
jgi:L-ascorbate metabolism protein UlaG (beta-lactamase superfamily)